MDIYGNPIGGGDSLADGGTISGDLLITQTLTAEDGKFNTLSANTASIAVLEADLEVKDGIILCGLDNPADSQALGILEEYQNAGKKYSGILRQPGTGAQFAISAATPKPTGMTDPQSLSRAEFWASNFNSQIGLTLGLDRWNLKLDADNFTIHDNGGNDYIRCVQNGLVLFPRNVKFAGDNFIIGNGVIDTPRIIFETPDNNPAAQIVVSEGASGESTISFQDEANQTICKMSHIGADLDFFVSDDMLCGGLDAVAPCARLEVRGALGLLNPRMTEAERDAIPSPLPGLQVWNIDANELELWDGSGWASGTGAGGHNSLNQAYTVGATITQTAAKPLALTGFDALSSALTIAEPGAATGPGFTVNAVGDIVAANLVQEQYDASAGAAQVVRRARGTPDAPTAVANLDGLGRMTFEGYSGAAYIPGAQIEAKAVENYTAGQAGSELLLSAVPVGLGSTALVVGLTVGQSETDGIPDTRCLGNLVAAKRIASAGTHLDLDVSRIGDPGAIAAATALEVSSTVGGFLPPRLSTAQRDALAVPPDGLQIFNTTTDRMEYRGPGSWEPMGRFVEGPAAGALDNAITVYDGVSGSLVRDSLASVDSAGRLKTVGAFPFAGRPWTTIYSLNTTVSIGLSTAETDIFNAGAPLPANGFTAGTMLRWRISGATANGSGDTCTIRIYMYNSVLQLDTGSQTTAPAPDEMEWTGTLRIGGTGLPSAYSAVGQQQYWKATTSTNIYDYRAPINPGNFDVTTPGANFRASAQWDVNDATVFIRNFSLEMVEGQ